MNVTVAFLGLSGGELILIFAVILILFGAKKIPEFAKGIGQGMKEFRKASREVSDEIQSAMDVDSNPPPPSQRSLPQNTVAHQNTPTPSHETAPAAKHS